MYRKIDFLSSLLEDGFRGSKVSTLFCGGVLGEQIDLELLDMARDRSWIKIPLDQKNFDWHQSKASILAVLEKKFLKKKNFKVIISRYGEHVCNPFDLESK